MAPPESESPATSRRPPLRLAVPAAAFLLLALCVGLPPEVHPWSRAACQILAAVASLALSPWALGRRPAPPGSGWLLPLLPLALASLLLAGCRARAVDAAADALMLLLAGALGAALAQDERALRAIGALLIAAACAVSSQAVLQRHVTYPAQAAAVRAAGGPLAHDIAGRLEEGRPSGPFTLPAALGGFLALALPQVLVLARGASGRAPRLGARAALPLLAYALYTTRSLGALLAAGVGFLIVLPPLARRRRALVVPLLLASILGGGALFLHERRIRLADASGGDPLSQRLGNWRAASRMIEDHPLFGAGPGSFGTICTRYLGPGMNEARFAHDSYLQAAAEWGLWILLPLGALLVAFARALRARGPVAAGDGGARLAALAGGGSFLAHNLGDFTAYLPGVALPAALLLEIGLAPRPAKGGAVERGEPGRRGRWEAAAALAVVAAVALHAFGAARSRGALELAQERALQGDLERALEAGRAAAAARPGDPDPPAFVAQLILAHGIDDPLRRPEGERAASRALALDPDAAILHYTRALYHLRAGEAAQAFRETYAAHLLYPLKPLYRAAAPAAAGERR